MKKIFISVDASYSNGCTYKVEGRVMRTSKDSLVVMKKQKINDLRTLQGSMVTLCNYSLNLGINFKNYHIMAYAAWANKWEMVDNFE